MTRLTRRELLIGGTAIVAAGALPVWRNNRVFRIFEGHKENVP
jgi:hypothetical protein